MKHRYLIFIGVLLIVAVVVVLVKRGSVDSTRTSNDNEGAEPIGKERYRRSDTKPSAPPIPEADSAVNKEDKIVNVLSNYNDQPIVFYGRVFDQFTNSVSNAEVDYSVRINNGTESTVKRGTVSTDKQGSFSISGINGESISVVPKKSGYALASRNGGGVYSSLDPEPKRIQPDSNNPVTILMWKLQGNEPLLTISKQYQVPYSAMLRFDLLTGQIVPTGGDVKLIVSRQPGVISGRNRLEWGLQVESVEGGIMRSEGLEEITYWAPESGYRENETFTFSTNAPNKWLGSLNTTFFMRSRNGQIYSKLGLSFRINTEPDGLMLITLAGVANTNGSRNWEADSNTLKPK